MRKNIKRKDILMIYISSEMCLIFKLNLIIWNKITYLLGGLTCIRVRIVPFIINSGKNDFEKWNLLIIWNNLASSGNNSIFHWSSKLIKSEPALLLCLFFVSGFISLILNWWVPAWKLQIPDVFIILQLFFI